MRAERALFAAGAFVAAAFLAPAAAASDERAVRQAASQPVQAQPAQPRRSVAATRATTAQPPAAQARSTAAAAVTPVAFGGAAAAIGTPIRHVAQTSGLSCVPYVRLATGMNISGNGRDWWHNAAGSYARGRVPERGAVLAFMGSGGMSRGHVAVVSRVVDGRTILIDHANWGGPGIARGTVMRGVRVIDVSDRNDWTAVRVQVGWDSSNFGRTYPTFGFIYNRGPDNRTLMAGTPQLQEIAEAPSPHVRQHAALVAETFGR